MLAGKGRGSNSPSSSLSGEFTRFEIGHIVIRSLGNGASKSRGLGSVPSQRLGDALGLSTVHINRTIKQLDRDGLLTVHANLLTVRDWPRLQEVADFDPAYLELVEPTVPHQ